MPRENEEKGNEGRDRGQRSRLARSVRSLSSGHTLARCNSLLRAPGIAFRLCTGTDVEASFEQN